MTDVTNKSSMKQASGTGENSGKSASRPYCVFYVQLATPKAIHADTVMACGVAEARELAAAKHKESMILHVRRVGSDGKDCCDKAIDHRSHNTGRHRPHQSSLPGARFINGEFRIAGTGEDFDLSNSVE